MPVSFLFPWMTALFPLAAAGIWYAYRAKGDGQRKAVSSIRLLKNLQRPAAVRALPKVPLRFFFECLLALLLAGLVAGFVLGGNSRRVLIAFDKSLSTEQMISDGRTVQDQLREKTNGFFSDLEFSTVVDGIDTERRSLVKNVDDAALGILTNPATHIHADAFAKLFDEIDLSAYDEIFIASDRPVSIPSSSAKITQASLGGLSLSTENIYADKESLANTKSTVVPGMLEFLDAKNALVKTVRVEIPAEGTLPVGSDSAFGLVADARTVRFRSTNPKDDRLERDDTVTLIGRRTEKLKVFTNNIDAPDAKEITNLLHAELIQDPKAISTAKTGDLAVAEITDGNFSNINDPCPACNELFIGNATAMQGSFSSWREASPLVRYVSPSLITLISGSPLGCPAWMAVDLNINGKAVLCHGTMQGAKKVLSGLPLTQVKQKNTFLTIMTLNIFSWLKDTTEIISDDSMMQESRFDRSRIVVANASTTVDQSALEKQKAYAASSEDQQHSPYRQYLILLVIALVITDFVYTCFTTKLFARGAGT